MPMSQAFQKDRQLFAILIFHYYHFQLLNRGGGIPTPKGLYRLYLG